MLVVRASTVTGSVPAPASKSYTHRALALALLTERSRIVEPLLSEDPLATLACVRALGGKATEDAEGVTIEGGALITPDTILDCMNSGTTMRLFTAIAALAPGASVLTGDASLRKRPMQPLLDALKPLGVEAWSTRGNGLPPVIVKGPLRGGRTSLPGDVSSQYVSALLIAGTQAREDLDLTLTSPLKSRPYVEITLEMLRHFGARVATRETGFHVPAGQRLRGLTYRVPGDYSSAAFPLCAAAVTGGEVTVTNLDPRTAQGDKFILECLRRFGAAVKEHEDGSVTVKGGALQGITVDLSDTPDMFPALCAVASHARGESVFTGAKHLRFKESDRIAAMVTELRKMGVDATEREDGAVLRGGPVTGARVHSYHDHRIEMALAVCGLAAKGETVVDDHESHAVSYPRFIEHFQGLGGHLEVRAT
ncbi:MAG TPA: 3-phosphoshikimate 1-carboxyvinyltransferase [Candidatus Thermoplasmatota archaeon]|nr:3-phosphoshikimate 1-carboxyvinyltransferase [Candidatus Thermoplasmatota archaeon]